MESRLRSGSLLPIFISFISETLKLKHVELLGLLPCPLVHFMSMLCVCAQFPVLFSSLFVFPIEMSIVILCTCSFLLWLSLLCDHLCVCFLCQLVHLCFSSLSHTFPPVGPLCFFKILFLFYFTGLFFIIFRHVFAQLLHMLYLFCVVLSSRLLSFHQVIEVTISYVHYSFCPHHSSFPHPPGLPGTLHLPHFYIV